MTRYSRIHGDHSQYQMDHDSTNTNIRKKPFSASTAGTNTYMAHDEDGVALAFVEVQQRQGRTNTHMTGLPGSGPLIADLQQTDAPNVETHDRRSISNTRSAKPGEQLVMFGIDHKPTRREVDIMYARDSLRGKSAAINLLGMADNATRDALGSSLLPSDNLSEHSLGLVNHLHQRGAISDEDMPDNIGQDSVNDITRNDAEYFLNRRHSNMFSSRELVSIDHRLPHAKARIRQIMGRSAPNLNTEPKAEQLQLEGFE
jgi:hypothetical protein